MEFKLTRHDGLEKDGVVFVVKRWVATEPVAKVVRAMQRACENKGTYKIYITTPHDHMSTCFV